MMINKTRILNEFIELVSVPCPSKDEKAEADLLVQKLQAMGLEVKVDDAGRKIGGTTGNVWAFLPGNVEGAAGLFLKHIWILCRRQRERRSCSGTESFILTELLL